MMLSKNLSLKEVTKSSTAIKLGISNHPGPNELLALKEIAQNVFQPLRDYYDKPIGISSGFRSKELNTELKGAKNSQHCKGEALDLDADIYGGIPNMAIFAYIKDNLEFDQLIWEFGTDLEPDWVHVSYRHVNNRKQVLRAIKENGKTKYIDHV